MSTVDISRDGFGLDGCLLEARERLRLFGSVDLGGQLFLNLILQCLGSVAALVLSEVALFGLARIGELPAESNAQLEEQSELAGIGERRVAGG